DGIRDFHVTGVQTCALPISKRGAVPAESRGAGVHHIASAHLELILAEGIQAYCEKSPMRRTRSLVPERVQHVGDAASQRPHVFRSEERRVGNERRSRWAQRA